MATKIDINANIESENKTGITGEKSLKSLRTYQLGVVYKDEYGRETPVFTNEDASFTIPKAFSNTKNSITAKVKNLAPDWSDSYKLFIKETSNEYYNLCMDRWYDAEDDNIWLSFPSAERNKIQEDTFIILKKQAASQESITEEARYKIIDIQNEAPDDIKTDYEMYGTADLKAELGATPESSDIKFNFTGGSNPWDATPFYDTLIAGDTTAANTDASGTNSAGFIGYPLEDVVVKFANTANDNTGWLDVTNIYIDTTPKLHIQLSKPLKGNAGDSTGSNVDICPGGACDPINAKLAKKVVKNKSEFNGRFFVKIRKDDLINQYIRSVGNPSPFFEIKQTMAHQALKVNKVGSVDAYWAQVARQWFIDNCSRQNVGTGGGTGGGGPFLEDDGYGLEGSGINTPPSTATSGWYNGDFSGPRSGSAKSSLRCTMELSFSYIDDENKNGFSMANALNSSDREFMEKMSTPGTMFRWKEDPYQHIYRIVGGTTNSQTSSTNGVGILNFGERNWQRKSKKNKTIRLYLKFKTTGYRLNDDQSGAAPTIQYYDNEADKWPFYYKSGGESYTPGVDENGNPLTISTTAAAAYDVWDPTRSGYTGSYSVTGTAYDTITQAITSTENAADNNTIQIVDIGPGDAEPIFTDNPAVWETEPKEDKGLDIYYEASQAYPLFLDDRTNELFAPFGAKVSCVDTINNKSLYLPNNAILYAWEPEGHGGDTALLNMRIDQIGIIDHTQALQEDQTLPNPNPLLASTASVISNLNQNFKGIEIRFTRQDGSYTTAKAVYFSGYDQSTNPPYSWFNNGYSPAYSCGTPGIVPSTCNDKLIIKLDRDIGSERVKLPYFNCWTFGNGVESDRIRDDFNAVRLDKGVKASTVLDEPYEEEQRTNGLIYSGIYNSNSGINNLNQFIAAEKITKDTQPSYGSIQKLKARDTNLVAFCEDKVLKIQANKDALYSADGKPQLIASNAVLGDTTTFAGEFGISKNPESFAEESFRMYFTDKQRGKVLRLSQDGITPISDIGMKDFFADNLKLYDNLIGSFDDRKGEYNLTMTKDN